MKNGSLCILMPTWERGLPLARFSPSLLNRFWPTHPPLFYCGAEGEGEDVEEAVEDVAEEVADDATEEAAAE